MTFYYNDWGDRGLVMVGLMALGAIFGVLLLLKGRRLSRVRSLFEALSIETPSKSLAPGKELSMKVGLLPAKNLKVKRLIVRLEGYERAAPEGEPMNALSSQVCEARVEVPVNRLLEAGREHQIDASFQVPTDSPPSFQTQLHQAGNRLHLEVEGEGFSPVTQSWEVPIRGATEKPSDAEVPDFGSRIEFEGLALTLDGGLDARVGEAFDAELVLSSETEMKHGGISVTLVWNVEASHLERNPVVTEELAPAGTLEVGETRIPLSLRIPKRVPHSYAGELLNVKWGLEVYVQGLIHGASAPPLSLKVAAPK